MSVLRPKPPDDPLRIEAAGCGRFDAALRDALEQLASCCRERVAGDLRAARLLSDYHRDRPASELFQALATARRLREEVDLVVLASDEPVGQAIRGVFESCCHPFHNHLSRGERGGRPRLFFDAGPADPDRTAGLLDLMLAGRGDDLLERSGLITLVSPERAVDEARLVGGPGRPFADAMANRLADDPGCLSRRTLQIEVAPDPAMVIFSPALLVPAAVAGIDVVQLLAGGRGMQQRFLEAPPTENPPLLMAAAVLAAERSMPSAAVFFDTEEVAAADGLAAWWRQGLVPTFADAVKTAANAEPFAWIACRLRTLEPRRATASPRSSQASPSRRECDPSAALTVELPRLDEHAVGQLLALQVLAAGLLATSCSPSDLPRADDAHPRILGPPA